MMIAWQDCESLLAIRYKNGGMSGASALHFARREIAAIQEGRHWTHGQPTLDDPHLFIIQSLIPDEWEQFAERVAIMEHDGGLSYADAEAQVITEIISRNYATPKAPENLRNIYKGSAAIKQTIAAGIGVKDFFAKSPDNESAAYTTDLGKTAVWWNDGQRRFKAFIRGRFLVLDIDRKPGKPDGLKAFYRLFPRETLPEELQNLPKSFPCYTQTPSGGFHLFFIYTGTELKLRELAPGVEVKEQQITCPGSRRKNGEYVLHGELSNAPSLYGLIIDAIEEAKRKKERTKAERSRPRIHTAGDQSIRYAQLRITLDALADEAAAVYGGHHDRQVSFAGRACRCKFSGAETLAYVKSRPDAFGNGFDTESTILSVFRNNGAPL